VVRLVAAGEGRVRLERCADTRHRGRFGLVWPGGYGIVGDVVADDGRSVSRPLTASVGAPPPVGGTDHQNRPGHRPWPTLLFHGDADALVPVRCSDAFARAHPESVTYVRVPGCDHTLAWNADPRGHEDALVTFLTGATG
jgi:pimeloyl-ACP methyl ester carboxylesterase